jgi:hypothetical protein
MPELRRIGVLLLTQATQPNPLEDLLLRDEIRDYRPAPSSTPHQNSTNIAELRSGARSFHKPLRGVKGKLARRYGHDRLTVGLNECAAWRLAQSLGPPYDELVPTTVLRFHKVDAATRLLYLEIDDGWGSLSSEQPGNSLDPSPLQDPAVNDPAAFFDALIAQQDRHHAQYHWDPVTKRLGLIDHGFAFARRNDPLNASVFLEQRHAEGRAALEVPELAALQAIEEADLVGLRDILDPDQGDALASRIQRMRSSGELIEPSDW